MSREIAKFRGKRIDNGKWVYGYYFITPLTDESTGSNPSEGWFFLTGRERHCISEEHCVYEVVPETVGQYTELNDVNDKEIYRGDIIEGMMNYGPGGWQMAKVTVNHSITQGYQWEYFDLETIKVIGDIYDNPEHLG